MYYFKLMNAYGATTGNRQIGDYPINSDFEPNNPEFRIVGLLRDSDLPITTIKAQGSVAEITTQNKHELNVDDPVYISGISSELYNGGYKVSGITSERTFEYNLPSTPNNLVIAPSGNTKVNNLISNKECDQNEGKTIVNLAGGLFKSSRFKSNKGKIAGAASDAIIGANAGRTIDGCW